jgi:hypothetical protein
MDQLIEQYVYCVYINSSSDEIDVTAYIFEVWWSELGAEDVEKRGGGKREAR